MPRRKPPENTDNHERWLISYADFLTLLFAFFVVMYSTSAVNTGDFRVLSNSIVSAFGLPGVSFNPARPGDTGSEATPLGLPMDDQSAGDNYRPSPLRPFEADAETSGSTELGNRESAAEVQGVDTALQSALGDLIAPDRLATSANDTWLEIKIPARMLFPSGSRALLDSAMPMLRALAETLRELPNEVVVQGHTDNLPIRNGLFPSNWELSTSRAAAVTRVFEEEGIDPARLSAVGFAATRPVADNATEEGRAENRRVVLVVRSSLLSEAVSDG